jgi:tRNA 2-thiouridine synthesizing protein A
LTLDGIYHTVVCSNIIRIIDLEIWIMGDSMSEIAAGIERRSQKKGEVGSPPVDKELNLKGEICPYTFIESMLALEEMETGAILRVIVDYPPAVCDVPRSLRNEGYEILDVSPINETDWAILVRNKEVA